MSLVRIAQESAVRVVPATFAATTTAAAVSPKQDGFELLTRYLPTETITLFVAALAATATVPDEPLKTALPLWFYVGFALLTPILLLVLTYLKQREAETASGSPPQPFRPHPWPPIAALIAFLVWALSVPGVLDPKISASWGGFIAFGALSVSTLLSLIDRAIGPKP
jgi:uncharacterized membrane protein YhdT